MSEVLLPHNWRPRNYQMPVWSYFQNTAGPRRAVCLWHRRAGKDLLAVNLIAVEAFKRVGTYWHVFPELKQGRAAMWHGSTKDGRGFMDHFPKEIVASENSTDLRKTFINGSVYQIVGTDNINSLVGTNPVGVVLSEYSLGDPNAWNYLRPILAENDGWALFIYTMRGRNHGFRLFEMAQKNPKWFAEKLVAGDAGTKREDGLPVISDAAIQEEREAGMPEELIQQEFYNSADAPLFGAYYSKQMEAARLAGRITDIPWESKLLVDTYWDLGMNDETVIWFVQPNHGEFRVIDYYKQTGMGLPHYAKLLNGQVEGYERMGDYVYGRHYAPHDISVRELGTGKSRMEVAKSLGVRFKLCPRQEVADGIEAVRGVLTKCWFDTKRCEHGIEALRSYRREYDKKNKVFRETPEHDWASHSADAFRTFAWAARDAYRDSRKRMQEHRAIDNYDYLRGRPTKESRVTL